MVSQDASATVDGLTGFSGLGYDLYDGATLTLGGSTVQTAPVVFAGYGKAVLDVDFNVVGQLAIMRGSLLNPFPVSQELDGVSITNRGAITVNRLAPFTYYGAAVLLGYHDPSRTREPSRLSIRQGRPVLRFRPFPVARWSIPARSPCGKATASMGRQA
jgi:hypothetical protein